MARELKICIVSCYYRDTAAADYTKSLKRALEPIPGTKVKVISADCACRYKYQNPTNSYQGSCEWCFLPCLYSSPNPNIGRLLVQSAIDVSKGFFFLKKCKRHDVIHYQQCVASFGFPPVVTLLGFPSSLARVITLHEIDFWQTRLPLLNYIYKKADALIVHAEATRRKILSLVEIPKTLIKVIPHGVWIPPLKEMPREEITFFGVPSERKGVRIMLKALRIIKDKGVNLIVNVYGNYSEKEKAEWSYIANTMGVGDRLNWGGYLSEEELSLKVQQSMFTLLPYLDSEASSVLLRVMACATPVIASSIGGIPEYLGDTGLLIPPNDPKTLACAMIKLFDEPDLRIKMGLGERERAATQFSWDRIAERTMYIYRSLL